MTNLSEISMGGLAHHVVNKIIKMITEQLDIMTIVIIEEVHIIVLDTKIGTITITPTETIPQDPIIAEVLQLEGTELIPNELTRQVTKDISETYMTATATTKTKNIDF